MSTRPPPRATLELVFSALGHAYAHLFTAFYFVVVLALEVEWGRPYHELVELWTLGALLVGLAALPAGWLADRWSAPGMMVVMFLGLGSASAWAGLARTAGELQWSLAGIGLFAAIYHPVGIAWVVRCATAHGKALGVNGIFGSFGVAASGIVTGVLVDFLGWRAAFMIPGAVAFATGVVLWVLWRKGMVRDGRSAVGEPGEPASGGALRAFVPLLLTMTAGALVFHANQTALPKLFEMRLAGLLGSGTLGVGGLVAAVYVVAGVTQVLGGHLADRNSVKKVYVAGLWVLVPALVLMARLTGPWLIVAAVVAAFLAAGILPAENMLLARAAPARHRSLAYAVKFLLAFGVAPLAVRFVSQVQRLTGGFAWVYWSLAACGALAATTAFLIPADEDVPPPTARPAGTVAVQSG